MEYENFKRLLHIVRQFTSPAFIPALELVEGQYKLRQPLAVECARSYHSTAHTMILSAIAVVSRANEALAAHKEWLRLQYNEELRVGVSTRMNRIRLGVRDVRDKREELSEVQETLEELEGEFLASARNMEGRASEYPEDSLVDWDVHHISRTAGIFSGILRELSDVM